MGLAAGLVQAAAPGDLEAAFQDPPASARPWVYWFWLNGNITKEGITADLEAMQRTGIGGVLIMEVDQGAPLGPVGFMSPKWRELFQHVVAEAGRLGLEVNMNNDAGWNGSGGPWIKPEESMQKVVWTETEVEGPRAFDAVLARPEAVANFYRDIAVLAVPAVGAYRIENIQVKAAYQIGGVGLAAGKDLPAEMRIDRARLVGLTSKMNAEGRLQWQAPAGKWTILRFGHTSTGVENAPSPASGRGLECDKLSKAGIEANFAGMMAKLIADVGPAAGKTLVTTHIDSWENGSQNWTARMREEFRTRRGYDLLPFLPVYTGRVVDSLEISERFLWDLRQTVSDLVVENYAEHLKTLAGRHGLKLSIEAYGGPTDNQPYAGRADEPMCEFWIGGGAMQTCKEMASAAHTYGRPILGAEAFTAADQERWLEHPASIKALGDQAICDGVNRFVFHRYAMQPWRDRRPGMTMGPWGIHYERTQTWWEWTPAWHQYLARCQHLLRQGRFVADLCYLQPEASPQGFIGHPPQAYDYDNCGAEVVLRRMGVKDGRIVLPDGMSYRVLVLPETDTMTPELLRKIGELAKAGATVIGPRPVKAPGLTDYPSSDETLRRLADEIWGNCDGKTVTEHAYGAGRVVWGLSPEQVLRQMGVRPDFVSPVGVRLRYIHRSAGDTDLYFVANPRPHDVRAVGTFRVQGKRPELWWPDSGRIDRNPVYAESEGATRVLLPLGPSGSVFVVFREKGGPAADAPVALSHEGRPVWSLLEAGPRLVVRSARYGVLDDPQRTRDVRDRVQRLVDLGERSFVVRSMAEGGDPAFGVVKTLIVEYDIGGKHFSAKGQDPDTIHLTGEAPKITVDKALYGVLDDPKRTRDVRQRVQRLVDAGEVSFPVPRMAEGDDPAFLVVKTLVIEYTMDGRKFTARGTDLDTMNLAVPEASERVAEVRGAAGRRQLEAWKPGRYELQVAGGASRSIDVAGVPEPLEVGGPWSVRFAPGWGAPEQVSFDKLVSWSDRDEEGVRHFSGEAVYEKTFAVPAELKSAGRRLYLDLGEVQVMADVKLNGRSLGLLWKPPYLLDISDAARTGDNTLEVKVVNLWPNRMVGDEQLPEDSSRNPDGTLKEWPQWLQEGTPSPAGRFTFTSWRLWRKDGPLLRSGLIGPVCLRSTAIVELAN